MANMNPSSSRSGSDEDESFGWRLFYDRQRNLVYYLHSYTGEVRWPRPETVGFVMHGLKPLPAQSVDTIDPRTDTGLVNPDIWSPYYPHVVMLPSGLVQVHPGPDSGAQGATEMWCGYNRFPLRGYGEEQYNTHRSTMPSGPRMLPPTWEDSRSGSPFLPPYPVAVLGHETEGKRPVSQPPFEIEEQFQTPVVDTPRSYRQLQCGELRRVQSSTDWPVSINTATSTDRKQPAPSKEKKEHNRKGYLLRQARKLMRDGSSSTSATPIPPTSTKQRKTSEVPPAKAQLNFSTREPNDQQRDLITYSDRVSPPHC
ncbi:hypothetical protein DVH05_003902 [Phytophthora capsici]|nr:hypothetical protein DVH05_003902 [Phytophthora capsici]